jgi:mitochondrial FAD-linked sulfhydryl oxidase
MINWGRPGWTFLHAVTFAYPRFPSYKTKHRYLGFFKFLRFVLPCPACRREFSVETRELGLHHFKNRRTLSKWLVKVHNNVNKRLGKRVVPFGQVKLRYLGYARL